jgi:glutamate carboxypeptidase
MNINPHPAVQWLTLQREVMLTLLEALVNSDSNSYDKCGVDAVGTHIGKFSTIHQLRC